MELDAALKASQAAVHAALLDSLDTPTALAALEDLVRRTNVYLAKRPPALDGCGPQQPEQPLPPNPLLLRRVAAYVTRCERTMLSRDRSRTAHGVLLCGVAAWESWCGALVCA